MRKQLYHLIYFLSNTGIRIGEARHVKWSDVRFDQACQSDSEQICEVRIGTQGKTGEQRFVQAQSSLNDIMKKWKYVSPYKKPDDYVWFGQSKKAKDNEQVKIGDVTGTFQAMLERIPYNNRPDGLLYDADGQRRVIYSLRHTYATLRLTEGNVALQDLAINMGCKVAMIEKHYSHVVSSQRRDAITQTKIKPKDAELTKAPVNSIAGFDSSDKVVLRVVEQYRMEKIDEATFLKIVGSGAQI